VIVFDKWIDDLCAALSIEDEVDVDAILDLARDAAHEVERRAAPVTTFLVGLAAGRSGRTDAAETAMATAADLLRQQASR
jgi:Domain of unknown function (DUF6457)